MHFNQYFAYFNLFDIFTSVSLYPIQCILERRTDLIIPIVLFPLLCIKESKAKKKTRKTEIKKQTNEQNSLLFYISFIKYKM